MKITHQFDQAELDRRITNAIVFYQSAHQNHKNRGAIVVISEDYFFKQLQDYDQLRGEGYTLFPSINFSPSCIYLKKPQALIDADVSEIIKEVTEAYSVERKQAYDAHVESIVAESVARTEREAAKKAELAREKAVEAARKDALAALGTFS